MKTIIRNINLLNVFLILIVILFSIYIISPMLDLKVKYALPTAKKTVGGEEESPAENQIPSITEYTKVSEENLFHPERKIPAEKKEEQPLPKPEFVLYGTLITDDMSLAYLEDLKAPRNTPGRGKRQIALKKGATMGGFTLREIEVDKVVMVRGEEKIVVPVNDPSRHKERKESAITTPTASKQPVKASAMPAQKESRKGAEFKETGRAKPSIQQPANQKPKESLKRSEPNDLRKR